MSEIKLTRHALKRYRKLRGGSARSARAELLEALHHGVFSFEAKGPLPSYLASRGKRCVAFRGLCWVIDEERGVAVTVYNLDPDAMRSYLEQAKDSSL